MATIFTLFSDKRCPTEIQDLIWYHFISQSEPRVLAMKLHTDLTGPNDLWDFSYHSPTAVPTALMICSQSRYLAKRRWTLGLGVEGNRAKIWVDYANDTLSFRDDGAYFVRIFGQSPQPSLIEFNAVPLVDRKKIRNVRLQWISLFHVMYRRDAQSHEEVHLQGVPAPQVWARFLLRTFPALDVLGLDLDGGEGSRNQRNWAMELQLLNTIESVFGEAGVKIEFMNV